MCVCAAFEQVVNSPERNKLVVDAYKTLAVVAASNSEGMTSSETAEQDYRVAMAFCCDIEHGEALADTFRWVCNPYTVKRPPPPLVPKAALRFRRLTSPLLISVLVLLCLLCHRQAARGTCGLHSLQTFKRQTRGAYKAA